MSKADILKSLRESSAGRLVETSKEPIDDIAVVKYLDGLRRKSTSIHEVGCLDWLFDHFSLRPGRFHDQYKEEKPKAEPKLKPENGDQEPWKKEGVSRATYFRKRKQ
jgi:hypothetical protein